MALMNYVGSNSFFKKAFESTFLEGMEYNNNCINNRLRELAKNAAKVVSRICSDLQKNESTIKFLEIKYIEALTTYAEILDEFMKFGGINASPSASTVKSFVKKNVPQTLIKEDVLNKANKLIKSGMSIDAAFIVISKSGMSIPKKVFIDTLKDYKYYTDKKSSINKSSSGSYILGSESYIKDCDSRVFGKSYNRSFSYAEIMKSHIAWVKKDTVDIADYIVLCLNGTGSDTDIARLESFLKQISPYVSHSGLIRAIDNWKKANSLNSVKREEDTSVKYGNQLMEDSSYINTASREEQQRYIWDYMKGWDGFSDIMIAALMANIEAEGDYSPYNAQNSYFNDSKDKRNDIDVYSYEIYDEIGFGLMQWTHWKRKTKLYDYTQEEGRNLWDMDTQLDYIYYELIQSGDYPATWAAFQQDDIDIYEATRLIYKNYDAPDSSTDTESAVYAKNLKERQELARAILEKFGR